MIKNIELTNFKSFIRDKIEFSKLTLLTGANSSGKSTIVQSILLLSQKDNENPLNGNAISLGDYNSVRNFTVARSENITIKCETDNGNFGVTLMEDAKFPTGIQEFKYEANLYYLLADRNGVHDFHSKNLSRNINFGSSGEYAISILEQNKSMIIKNAVLLDNQEPMKFEELVCYWLTKICGYSVSVENIVDSDFIKLSYFEGEKNDNTRYYRPRNVGTGLSYLLTQIIIALHLKENDLLIIENPEIHLHPKAQSKLVKFLMLVSDSGKQVILESHSDHFFNAIRVAIANDKNKVDEYYVNYVYKLNSEEPESKVIKVEIGEFGNINNYKDGLFDQFIDDVGNMIGKPW